MRTPRIAPHGQNLSAPKLPRANVFDEPLIIRLREEEWDLAVCEHLEQLLVPALEHPNVIIDMTAVRFLDSSCLHKLVHMYGERVTRRGFSPARLVVTSPNVRKLFAILNLDQVWRIFGTVDEALQSPDDPRQPE
jgi:anti-anti-sigma factor